MNKEMINVLKKNSFSNQYNESKIQSVWTSEADEWIEIYELANDKVLLRIEAEDYIKFVECYSAQDLEDKLDKIFDYFDNYF